MSAGVVRLLVAEVVGEPMPYWLLFDDFAAAVQYADGVSEVLRERVRIRVVGHATWQRGQEPARCRNFWPSAFERACLRACRPRLIVGDVPEYPWRCLGCE